MGLTPQRIRRQRRQLTCAIAFFVCFGLALFVAGFFAWMLGE